MRIFNMLLSVMLLSLSGSLHADPETRAPIQLRLVAAAGQSELPTREGGTLRVGPPLLPEPVVVVSVEQRGAAVRVTLAPQSARAVAELTRRFAGQKLAIVIGGVVQSTPLVRAPIVDGLMAITLHSAEDAAALAHTIDGK
jgi:nitrous oxidase accessory protein NosD